MYKFLATFKKSKHAFVDIARAHLAVIKSIFAKKSRGDIEYRFKGGEGGWNLHKDSRIRP